MEPAANPPLSEPQASAARVRALLREVSKVVIGKPEVLERVAWCVLVNGHVLLEDYPGLAKTVTVKTFARALGLRFSRIQFTPDLLPADITGSFYFNLQANRFELRKGPIFTNVLLADEINRAPPKTQSALLEAMQERQTTLEGDTHALPRPFLVFATQNPIEIEGTYPLPEAQLDRFVMRLAMGYPSPQGEIEMLTRFEAATPEQLPVEVALSPEELQQAQQAVARVRADADIKDYVVRLVAATRQHPQVRLGASPRGSLAVLQLAKARAFLQGRGYVVPDDVKVVAGPALNHRLLLTTEARARSVPVQGILDQLLQAVPVPRVPAPQAALVPPQAPPAPAAGRAPPPPPRR
jgi:MoxR-like ATPase